jgi:hypothetical protein
MPCIIVQLIASYEDRPRISLATKMEASDASLIYPTFKKRTAEGQNFFQFDN